MFNRKEGVSFALTSKSRAILGLTFAFVLCFDLVFANDLINRYKPNFKLILIICT
jgi:hypothetical protein